METRRVRCSQCFKQALAPHVLKCASGQIDDVSAGTCALCFKQLTEDERSGRRKKPNSAEDCDRHRLCQGCSQGAGEYCKACTVEVFDKDFYVKFKQSLLETISKYFVVGSKTYRKNQKLMFGALQDCNYKIHQVLGPHLHPKGRPMAGVRTGAEAFDPRMRRSTSPSQMGPT